MRGVVLLWLMLIGVPIVASAQAQDVAIEQASFRDWAGRLYQRTLADGSVISEYTAFTQSRNAPGAQLHVTFTPRFRCAPMIRILLPETIDAISSRSLPLLLTVDQDSVDFPYFLDDLGAGNLLAYSADSTSQKRLLQQLDIASHLTLPRNDGVSGNDTLRDDPYAGTVHFSLLGSRRSALAVLRSCKTHVPVPFSLESVEG